MHNALVIEDPPDVRTDCTKVSGEGTDYSKNSPLRNVVAQISLLLLVTK